MPVTLPVAREEGGEIVVYAYARPVIVGGLNYGANWFKAMGDADAAAAGFLPYTEDQDPDGGTFVHDPAQDVTALNGDSTGYHKTKVYTYSPVAAGEVLSAKVTDAVEESFSTEDIGAVSAAFSVTTDIKLNAGSLTAEQQAVHDEAIAVREWIKSIKIMAGGIGARIAGGEQVTGSVMDTEIAAWLSGNPSPPKPNTLSV